ncbi:MAG: Calx-beta domain-containing protein, partial [Pirellula sp.]
DGDGYWYLTIPASTSSQDNISGSFNVAIQSDTIGEPIETIELRFETVAGAGTLTNASVGLRTIDYGQELEQQFEENPVNNPFFHNFRIIALQYAQQIPDGAELSAYQIISIKANDIPGLTISATNTKLTESSGTVSFTVSATNAATTDIVVPITYSGTATSKEGAYDYTKKTSPVTIKAGNTSGTGTFHVSNDSLYEDAETIIVKIGSPTSGNASLSNTTSVTFRIAANDAPPASPPKTVKSGDVAVCTSGCTTTIVAPSNPGPAVVAEPVGNYSVGQAALYFPSGYISGGTAFFDANKNSVLDFLDLNGNDTQDSNEPSEVSTTTSLSGFAGLEFSAAFDQNNDGFIDSSEGQIVVVGGIDTSIDLPLVGALIGPAGVYVPTPLTTLMASLVNEHGFSVSDASDRVQESLGLPIRDLRVFDHLAATLRGDSAGPEIFAAEVKVQDTIASAGTFFAAFPNAPTSFALANLVASEIAYKMLEPDSNVDLSNTAVIESILNAVIQQTGLIVNFSVVAGAAEIMAASNQAIDAVPVTVDEPYLSEVARVQKVSQTSTLTHLVQVAQGTASIATVVAANTGTALTNQVSLATVGDIVPPVAGITDARIVEGSTGQRELVFTVALSKPSSEPVSISY